MPGGAMPGPGATPMAAPQKKEGKDQRAMMQVHIAMNMLEQALVTFGTESDEGAAVLKVLTTLGKKFGDSSTDDLHAAELQEMVASNPSSGGGSEMQQKILGMMQGRAPAQLPGRPGGMPGAM